MWLASRMRQPCVHWACIGPYTNLCLLCFWRLPVSEKGAPYQRPAFTKHPRNLKLKWNSGDWYWWNWKRIMFLFVQPVTYLAILASNLCKHSVTTQWLFKHASHVKGAVSSVAPMPQRGYTHYVCILVAANDSLEIWCVMIIMYTTKHSPLRTNDYQITVGRTWQEMRHVLFHALALGND